MYCIREDYTARLNNDEADERKRKDECQDEVYAAARKLMDQHGLESIMDIGTGSGFKLMKYFKDKRTLGTDIEPNLSWIKQQYPERDWFEAPFTGTIAGYQVILSADVIEHLVDPDELLGFIKRCEPKLVVLSTPNRDNLMEHSWAGPPRNLSHVREWNAPEFRRYLEESGFEVLEHIFPDPSRRDYSTMWCVCKLKS